MINLKYKFINGMIDFVLAKIELNYSLLNSYYLQPN